MNTVSHTKATLIDHMGSDLTVVNAARVSFESESWWEDEASLLLKQGDQKLIQYLARENHWSPFAHPQLQFRYEVPIFVARQEFKHIVGFQRNEASGRYLRKGADGKYLNKELTFFLPDEWHSQPANAKQGAAPEVRTHIYFKRNHVLGFTDRAPINSFVEDGYRDAQWRYETLVENGIAVEEARMVLPQAMLTSYYVTGSLAAFARFYNQRTDPHAQLAIRQHAALVGPEIAKLYPYSWEVLTNVSAA